MSTAAPYRTDRVDDEARRQTEPGVILASPVLQPCNNRQAWTNSGPAARWIAPSTPPPPSNDELAAFTIASTFSVVMSACNARTLGGMRLS